jgi:23S rRNA (cytosine1962-C5)-methyltransferase
LKSLFPAPGDDTNAWRIYHDAGSEIWVDHFDGRWLVQTKEARFPGFLEKLAEGVARSIYWRPRDRSASTAPEHVSGERVEERFLVRENGANFWIDFGAGYSSGIFVDQRVNRRRVGESVEAGQRVLNTFAYTGGFSVVAARSGAITTTLDLSGNYLDWTWENFAANGIDSDEHFGVRGDAFEWMRTFARQERTFRGIVLDPPTFSRSGRKTFRTDSDYAELAALASVLVDPGGWMLCCANTHRLGIEAFRSAVESGVAERGRGVESIESLPMPPEFHDDDYLKSLWVVVR